MLENALNMIDLVLTHLTHPWGPPGTLETLGDHWRPLATMPENGQNGQNDSETKSLFWSRLMGILREVLMEIVTDLNAPEIKVCF